MNNSTKTRIPVFFATDRAYLPYLACCVASMQKHASDEYIYDVRILTSVLDEGDIDAVFGKMSIPNIDITLVNLAHKVKQLRSQLDKRLRDYYSESIYYRMFIPSLFPELRRAIYMDCDMILTDDIAKLYFTDIGDNNMAAVADECIAPNPPFVRYVRESVGSAVGSYVNSGLLLIDLDKFREDRIEEKFLHLLTKYNFETVAPDQDYLNFLNYGKIYYLDCGWNKQPIDSGFGGEIHLIHFNHFSKPWFYRGVKYEELFWDAAAQTPCYAILREGLMNYTDSQREIDREGARSLLLSAQDITDRGAGIFQSISHDYFDRHETD